VPFVFFQQPCPIPEHRRAAVAKFLRPKLRIHEVELPDGVQPDQLSPAEINALISPANWTS
jgi:hypothetical protein